MKNPDDLDERVSEYLLKIEHDRQAGFDRRAEAASVLNAATGLCGPVLDIGVGKGNLAIEVARRGFDVVGVDTDPEALRLARALAARAGVSARLRLIEADAAALPFQDGSFGAVVSMNALHHLATAEPVLDSVARVVRSGGLVVLTDLSAAGLDWIGKRHLEDKGVPHPVGLVTLDAALAGLADRGLEVRCVTLTRWETIAVLRKPSPVMEVDSQDVAGHARQSL